MLFNTSEPPSASDPAFADVSIRNRICKDVTRSRYFRTNLMKPVNTNSVYNELKQEKYAHIFHLLGFHPTKSKNPITRLLYPRKYTNAFSFQKFDIHSDHSETIQIEEYVFVCLLRSVLSNDLVPVYVSKEYNVLGEPYKAGRFLFGNLGFHRHQAIRTLLAENPASVREKSDFNIELYYLRIRANRRPGKVNPR